MNRTSGIQRIHPRHSENRAAAVRDMLKAVPLASTLERAQEQADSLAGYNEMQRACWARCCGHPYATSDATWDLLVRAVRNREPIRRSA